MSLPDLADLKDLEDRLGAPLTAEQQGTALRLLADASAKVRLYTGQIFTQVPDDVVVLKIRNGKVRLPQRPIAAVSAVTVLALDGTQTPIAYRWEGAETVCVVPQVLDSFAWNVFRVTPDTATVTYTHGYADDELPPALVGIVVQIVGRALGTNLMQSGIQQEAIAGYSYSIGSAAAAGGFGLLPAEKDALDVFTRQASVISVGP